MKQSLRTAHQGAALFTALIFLIIITMLSLTAMRGSMLELRMASNQEVKNSAFLSAQAIVDATIGDSANMPTLAAVGAMNCMASDPDAAACNTTGLVMDDNFLAAETTYFNGQRTDGEVYVRTTRLAPLTAPAPRAIGTSASLYSVATYQVDGTYDLSAIGKGRAEIREGLMMLIAN